VLAKNNQGAKTISKLQMIANRHHHYKPLLPYPILFENTDNLFISTACSLGTIGQALDPKIQSKTFEDGENFLNILLDKFGKDNVSLEFQFHPGYPGQGIINEKLLDLYEMTDVKYCIVTTDAHYLNNRATRRNLQADNWNKSVKEVTPTLESNCFGTPMKIKKFAEDSGFSDLALVDTMIKNTVTIADKCNVDSINNIGQSRVLPRFKKHDNFKKIFLKDPRCKNEK
jgi:DNA polymerase III alpha subunit